MTYTRRELGQLMLTLPAAGLLLPRNAFGAFQTKPNSKWAGVQVGLNVPYNFGPPRAIPPADVIAKTAQLGVSAVELRAQPIELFLGAAKEALEPPRGGDAKAAAAQLREWRLKTNPADAAKVRKQFDEAGIKIDVVKFDGIYNFSDPEMDYAFGLAKSAGARAISCELEHDGTKRLGEFATKHKFPVAYHGHTKTPEAMFEETFAQSKYNWANVDIGHWVAGGLGDPVEMIRKHHDRITHIHVKDRKKLSGTTEGPNTPFGEGDTPIKEVLRLIRDNKWPINAVIEFEYPVPAGSDRMAEMAKCVQYCKDALMTKS
jgi:sugar phosphate isomerase/epimerase